MTTGLVHNLRLLEGVPNPMTCYSTKTRKRRKSKSSDQSRNHIQLKPTLILGCLTRRTSSCTKTIHLKVPYKSMYNILARQKHSSRWISIRYSSSVRHPRSYEELKIIQLSFNSIKFEKMYLKFTKCQQE